jgi:hypothetical protein
MDSDMAPPDEHATGSRFQDALRHRTIAVTTAALALAIFGAGAYLYRRSTTGTGEMMFIELAGKAKWIRETLGKNTDRYARALYVDFGFIASYFVAIAAGAALGWSLSLTRAARRWSLAALGAVVIAALCAVAENLALLMVIRADGGNRFAVAAQALAFTKFVFVVPAACIAGVAIVTTLWRALISSTLWTGSKPGRTPRLRSPRDRAMDQVTVIQPSAANDPELYGESDDNQGVTHSAWRANTHVPQSRRPPEPGGRESIAMQPDTTGICVSGGGIRSAAFTLGALDALRPVLEHARYLVSVSGGGYAAGALQMALKSRDAASGRYRSVAHPKNVYVGGSAELNHTRQHGKYLADGAVQWMVALGTVLRGFLVSVLILVLTVVVLGRLVGHLYAMFLDESPAIFLWPPLPGVLWTIGIAAILSLFAWIPSVLWEDTTRAGQWLGWAQNGAAAVAVFMAVAGIGLPLLAGISQLLLWRPTIPNAALGSSALILSYLSVLIAIGKRPGVRKATGKLRAWWAGASPRERSLAATAAVYAGQIIIVAGLLLLLGDVLANARLATAESSWPFHLPEICVTAILAAILAFFAASDQVRWSLHRFYRKRLATAFAVRRRRDGGRVWAEAYDYSEQTSLHEYAAWTNASGFPQVILLCAAHVSGPEMAPPGRKVVSWTMSGDYVGSPMLGWAPTENLQNAISKVLQRDLTLQAAQAISGAALASQMGRMNHPYTRLLTLTNVRLGTWLPNPAYIHDIATRSTNAPNRDWWLPRMPRLRYLVTWARELTGSFPADGPLVFVTDGGHYENLGLVELLRHRCGHICCIDGSGDRRDVAQTLAQAVELAYEELGVIIQLDDPGRLSAGPDGPRPEAPDQLLAELKDRLAKECVITGHITYPDLGPGLPAQVGSLVIAKAVLTQDAPFDVLAHATCHPSFPNDSTADQWFDFARFDAYHSLGRHVGEKALPAMWRHRGMTYLDTSRGTKAARGSEADQSWPQ